MSLPRWTPAAWLYYAGVVLLGWAAIAMAAWSVFRAFPAIDSWILLAIPLILLKQTYIQLPNLDARLCPSGLFVLYAGMIAGPAPAALLAALDAILNSLQMTSLRSWRLAFNLAVLPLAITIAAGIAPAVSHPSAPDVVEVVLRAATITLLYYVANVGLVLGMMALTGGRAAVLAARSALLWSWAEYLVGGVFAGLLAAWGAAVQTVIVLGAGVLALTCRCLKHYFSVVQQLEHAVEDKVKLLDEKEELLEEVRATHLASLETLALAIEAKDPRTHGHVRRVQRLSTALGERMGIDGHELEALRIGSLLHDIGKLAIPEYLLYGSKKATREDEEKLKSHARLGADILRNSRLDPTVMSIVLHHHERYDGSGYPTGRRGDAIPLGARILAVADTYDKLREPGGATPLSRAAALECLAAEAGRGLDPAVVNVLCAEDGALLDAVEVMEGAASRRHPRNAGEPDTSFVHDFHSSHQEAKALYTLIQGIRTSPRLEPCLETLIRAISEVIPSQAALVFLPDGNSDDLTLVHSSGASNLELEPWTRQQRRLRRDEIPAMASTVPASARGELAPGIARMGGDRFLAYTILPLKLSPGEDGVLVLCHEEFPELQEDQRRILNVLLEHGGPAVANARYYDQYLHESKTDVLTGVGNSRRLREEGSRVIAEALRSGSAGCVIMLDLNGFKAVNDTLGHHQGDRMLVQVAQVLSRQVRREDLVTRNGGDEFVMILLDISAESVRERLERIRSDASELWPEDWPHGDIGTSAGVAWFPQEGQSLEELLELADTRMYEDKRLHRRPMRVSRHSHLRAVRRAAG